MLDPERPRPEMITNPASKTDLPTLTLRQWVPLLAVIAALVSLTLIWHITPANEWLTVEHLSLLITDLRAHAFSIPIAILLIALGGSLAIPMGALIMAASLVFAPWQGFLISQAGIFIGCLIGYALGNLTGRRIIHQLNGSWINQLSQKLAQRGILTMITVRVIPVAPFAVINLVAGASHIRLREYLIGTMLGMLPATLIITLFAERFYAAIRNPDLIRIGLVFAVLALAYLMLWRLKRWLMHRSKNVLALAPENK